VEGVNIGAFLLGYLGILVFGITSLVALGLRITRRTREALLTFAAGLLSMTLIAAVAILSFLLFYEEGREPTIMIMALSLLVAGGGQFIAALRSPGSYGVAFGWAAGSLAFQAAPFLGIDAVGMRGAGQVLGVRSLSLPGVNLGLALSLLLAVLSLMSAVVSPRKKTSALLCTMLGGLGCIAGFAAGDACVRTRCTLVQGFPGGGPHRVRVEVDVLGERVSDVTGFATIPREGLSLVRAVSPVQAAWVYGPLAVGAAAGAAAGLVVGWVIATLLVRQSGEGVHARPLGGAERPREQGS
jgi:hypothetical protein